jgi:hypothetical protein
MYFPDSTTINSTVTGLVHVGKNSVNRNSSPTVSIVAGADLWQSAMVFNGSSVTMSGGRIRESLIALDTSTVSILDGEVGGYLGTGSEGTVQHKGGSILMNGGKAGNAGIDLGGTLSLRGGTIDGTVIMSRGSSLYMHESSFVFGQISVGHNSQAYIFGGNATNGLTAISNARVNFEGGTIGHTVTALAQSTIAITGGHATFVDAKGASTITLGSGSARMLSAQGNAVITMTGGGVDSFSTDEDGTGNLYGGTVHGDVTAFRKSTINIYGGTIGGKINAYGTVNIRGRYSSRPSFVSLASAADPLDVLAIDRGLVQFFGSELSHTLLDPDFFYSEGPVSGSFSKYGLTGVLVDGTELAGVTLYVQNGTGASFALITEVPEPAGLALVSAGLVLIICARRRSGLRLTPG